VNIHAYTEDQLVEQPAIALFAELGWQTVSAMDEVFGTSGTLGRETSGEVALSSRLRAGLERLNPQLPSDAIASALDELTRDRSAMSLATALACAPRPDNSPGLASSLRTSALSRRARQPRLMHG